MMEEHQFYNCIATLEDDSELKIDANYLHNNNLDLFENWKCWAGSNRIYIDSEKNVYSGQCLNDQLGNLKTEWNLVNNYTICKRKTCTGCTDDLIIRKQQ